MLRISSICLILITAVAGYANDDATRTELDRLGGKWRITSLVIAGQEVIQGNTSRLILVFNGDRLRFGASEEDQFRLTIDPATNPRVVDFQGVTEDNKGDEYEAIYRLQDDTLEICINTPAGIRDRPTEFASPDNTGLLLLKLERVKE